MRHYQKLVQKIYSRRIVKLVLYRLQQKKQRPANLQHSLASSLISDDDYNSVVSVNTVYKTLLELDECLSSSPVTKKNGRIR